MPDPFTADCGIIGGGAAGLAAAVFLSRLSGGRLTAVVLEKGPRVGKKLLATGNGTCNLSNRHATVAHYHGQDPHFAVPALAAFPPAETVAFFTAIGVECVERENGRIYPLCAQAGAVLDCLRLTLAAEGTPEECSAPVTAIRPVPGGFLLYKEDGTQRAVRRVLVCVGGAASPALGGSADGYGLLTALGHTRTPLFPAIVQVRTDPSFVKAAKGVRVDAQIRFERQGRTVAEETGEVLFTEYGLSGPAVMQASRCVADWERRRQGTMTAVLNLLSGFGGAALIDCLRRRAALPGRTVADLLTGLLHKRLGQTVLRAIGYTEWNAPVSALREGDLRRIAEGLAGWRIPVQGTQGMGGAQVTAGGIATAEFDPQTMQSRLIPGLYAAGEVLDIDGDCGGYNLQWAWASAHAAARDIVRSLKGEAASLVDAAGAAASSVGKTRRSKNSRGGAQSAGKDRKKP